MSGLFTLIHFAARFVILDGFCSKFASVLSVILLDNAHRTSHIAYMCMQYAVCIYYNFTNGWIYLYKHTVYGIFMKILPALHGNCAFVRIPYIFYYYYKNEESYFKSQLHFYGQFLSLDIFAFPFDGVWNNDRRNQRVLIGKNAIFTHFVN